MNIVVCQDQVQTFLCWMGSKAMKAKMTEKYVLVILMPKGREILTHF